MVRAIFVTFFLSSAPKVQAFSQFYLGLGSFSPDAYIASAPDGATSSPHLTASAQYEWISRRGGIGLRPEVFLSLQEVESPDNSYSASWQGLSFPITYRLLKISKMRLILSGGVARLVLRMAGSGGYGGMDGTELWPSSVVESKSLYWDVGISIYLKKFQLSGNAYLYRLASSNHRMAHLRISLSYGVL